MLKINLFDENFRHAQSSSFYNKPTHFEFIRDQYDWDGITLFTDDWIIRRDVDLVKSKTYVAWLMEPRAIKPHVYDSVDRWSYLYDLIITHDNEILSKYSSKSSYCPVGGCWIDKEDQMVHKKNKLLSIIVSEKNFTLGHKLRHKIVDLHKNELDIFGRAYNPVDKKIESLKDYMFHVVVENSSVDGYFTEKIIDCFATGTVPIYWGCKNIDRFFDSSGILCFSNFSELSDIIKNLSYDKYRAMTDSVFDNFNRYKQFEVSEDWMYKNIVSNLW